MLDSDCVLADFLHGLLAPVLVGVYQCQTDSAQVPS
jgi:hypothetical protein